MHAFFKVCIIGAGPAGIHMAMKLKKLGHSDVTIFEKSNRVGGKSNDVKFRGASYPIGTIFLEPTYFGGTSSTGTFGQILRPRRSQIYSVKSNLLCRSRLLLCQSKFTKSIFHEIQKAKDRVN